MVPVKLSHDLEIGKCCCVTAHAIRPSLYSNITFIDFYSHNEGASSSSLPEPPLFFHSSTYNSRTPRFTNVLLEAMGSKVGEVCLYV